MILRTITTIVIGTCAVGVLGLLYLKSQSVDLNEHHNITDTLRQLTTLNSRWDEDVLQSKLSLSTNYDPVAAPLAELENLYDKLNTRFEQMPNQSQSLRDKVIAYEDLIQEKDDMVEQFKGENAILRNSLHFISTAIDNLIAEIDKEAAQLSESSPPLIDLRNQAQQFLANLLRYNQLSRQELVEPLNNKITQLRSEKDQYSIAIQDKLNTVATHAQVVINKKPVVDELLTDIVNLPIASAIHDIEQAYTGLHEQQLLDNNRYRTLLFAYAGFLLLWITYIGFRLRASYKQVNTLNTELQSANEHLEERVVERTQELSVAYDQLKQSQTQLVQSEKMASLGQMVAGVAHEINTPLAYCRSNVDLVKERLPELEALTREIDQFKALVEEPGTDRQIMRSRLAKIVSLNALLTEDEVFEEMDVLLDGSISGIDQIREIVMNLKDFSRLDQDRREKIDLNQNLDSVLVIANNVLKQHEVEIIKDYGELSRVNCAPSQINQVFLNLIVNACQAIGSGGTITLRTIDKEDHIDVLVEDNGKGIPEDVMEHIFDPFFTTKEVGEGTGLGLSISYKIIQDHGGSVSVDSKLDQGTCFTVSLPIAAVKTRLVAA